MPPCYKVTITLISSDQTYKDIMCTLNAFFDNYNDTSHDLCHTLIPLMTSGYTSTQ